MCVTVKNKQTNKITTVVFQKGFGDENEDDEDDEDEDDDDDDDDDENDEDEDETEQDDEELTDDREKQRFYILTNSPYML